MRTVEGNLVTMAVDGSFDVIIHGCNCFCNMGKGVAKQIAEEWRVALKEDQKTSIGNRKKLGRYSSVQVFDKYGGQLVIVNAYTQYGYGGCKRNANYNAIRFVFQQIKKDFPGKKIGIPMIGAGLAGGDWRVISGIIKEEMNGENITVVCLDDANMHSGGTK